MNALQVCFIARADNEFHRGDSGDMEGLRGFSFQPRFGGRRTTQTLNQDVRIEKNH
jgi:hypothetical protein